MFRKVEAGTSYNPRPDQEFTIDSGRIVGIGLRGRLGRKHVATHTTLSAEINDLVKDQFQGYEGIVHVGKLAKTKEGEKIRGTTNKIVNASDITRVYGRRMTKEEMMAARARERRWGKLDMEKVSFENSLKASESTPVTLKKMPFWRRVRTGITILVKS
jgi:hypothetical protein